MKKAKRKVDCLSRGATDEEIVRWTKSHDVFDRLETGVCLKSSRITAILDQALREAISRRQHGAAQYALAAGDEGCAQ